MRRSVLSLAALSVALATPISFWKRQDDSIPSTCQNVCLSAINNINECSDTDYDCICSVIQMNDAGESCLTCLNDNNASSGEFGTAMQQIVGGCNQLATLTTSSGAASPTVAPVADATATALASAGSVLPETVLSVWQPTGDAPLSGSYTAYNTGGPNTTLIAEQVVYSTDSAGSTVATATVTDLWVVSPTEVAEVVYEGDYRGVEICEVDGSEGVCEVGVFEDSGSDLSLLTAATFTATGSANPVTAAVNPLPTDSTDLGSDAAATDSALLGAPTSSGLF